MGVRGEPDEQTAALVLDCLDEVRKTATPRYVKKLFDYDGTSLVGGFELSGKSIKKFLTSCEKAVVMCATLGRGIDIAIKRYQTNSMARAAVFDACAAAYIEEYCDEISKTLETDAAKKDFCTTRRFSPGYGDFPIQTQKDILRILSAQRIGVALLDSYMLAPSKSVTAIVGYRRDKPDNKEKCAYCDNKNCKFRR